MDKKLLKFLKISRSKNQRSIIIILGNEAVYKVPDLYKVVMREKLHSPIWFSKDPGDIRKIGWLIKENDNDHEKDVNISVPQVIHVSDNDIENTPLQLCHFVVIQDKENIKPSDLVHIVESAPGKGVLVFIFSKVQDFSKFASPKDCDFVKSRFMRRFFASFISCPNCIVLNHKLDILFVPKNRADLPKTMVEKSDLEKEKTEAKLLQSDGENSEILDNLTKICSTEDQTKLLVQCFDALKRRSLHSTISALSARGRGKSLVLGLAIAGAIALKYSNIFISSLSYDNVKIIFKYLLSGLDAMQYKEDEDYDLIQSVNPKFNNVLLGLNIFRDHPQAVRFIFAGDVENKLEQAELVVIDEAASIPLPLLKKLLGPYVVLMASTTEGCGGSGKYLYENMISVVRRSPVTNSQDKTVSLESLFPTSETSLWKQISLTEPTNYSGGDEVENWINKALCFECSVITKLSQGCPDPERCRLFYVCQETLFSYEPYAEKFLQQLMSLFFCTKRQVSPDILLKIADDKNYHIFCLLPPFDPTKNVSYEILCAVLVHTEKHVPWNVVYSGINQSEGLQDCFNKWSSPSGVYKQDFLAMQGIHIVDIVTHPNYRKMGYGSCALRLLQEFYDGKWISLDDKPYVYSCKSKKCTDGSVQSALPLLLQLTEVEPESVDYILVSYYLTPDLLRFWKKGEFIPVYISGEKNSAQEHLCMMLKGVGSEISTYMKECWRSFCEYYFLLLSSDLKYFSPELALNLLNTKFSKQLPKEALTKEEIDVYLKPQRMKSLELYFQSLGDLHCIMPCIPVLAKLFFRHRFVGIEMSVAQQVIFLAFGMQHKTVEDISADLSLASTQIHGLLNRTIKKLTSYLTNVIEKTVEKTIAVRDINMVPVAQALDDELEEAGKEQMEELKKLNEKRMEDLKKLKEMKNLSEYAVKGSDDDWGKALHSGRKTLVSIKSIKKAPEHVEFPSQEKSKSFKHKKKGLKRKR